MAFRVINFETILRYLSSDTDLPEGWNYPSSSTGSPITASELDQLFEDNTDLLALINEIINREMGKSLEQVSETTDHECSSSSDDVQIVAVTPPQNIIHPETFITGYDQNSLDNNVQQSTSTPAQSESPILKSLLLGTYARKPTQNASSHGNTSINACMPQLSWALTNLLAFNASDVLISTCNTIQTPEFELVVQEDHDNNFEFSVSLPKRPWDDILEIPPAEAIESIEIDDEATNTASSAPTSPGPNEEEANNFSDWF